MPEILLIQIWKKTCILFYVISTLMQKILRLVFSITSNADAYRGTFQNNVSMLRDMFISHMIINSFLGTAQLSDGPLIIWFNWDIVMD